MMNPAIAALLAIAPRPVPGAALLAGLYAEAPAGVEELLEMQAEIEASIIEADKLADRSKKATDRCLKLKPVSAPQVPTGF